MHPASFRFRISKVQDFGNFELSPMVLGHSEEQGFHCLQRYKQVFMADMHHNFNLWPLKSQKGPSLVYCINVFGKIHQNEKG